MAAGSDKKSRRSKGEGSFTRHTDGRWMGRYWADLNDGTKKRQYVMGKDRDGKDHDEVLKRFRAEQAMADKGIPALSDAYTTGDYLEYWLNFIDPMQVRATTLQTHTCVVKKHLLPRLGHIPLAQLKPDHIRMMLVQMQNNGCGRRSMQMARNTLSAALRDAQKSGYVHRNVARLVDSPKYTPLERKHWTKEQVLQFLKVAKAHRYYVLFLLLFYYGLRRGEVLGLRWQDIDFEKNIIRIRQALSLVNYKATIGPLKTNASRRDLPMLPFIREALIAHFEASEKYDDDLVFHTSTGNPVYPNIVAKIFRKLAVRAGLPPISLHEARHTTATLLAESWSSPKEAQAILGHSSITTTLQIYTHTNYDKKEQALAALANNFM